MNNFNRIKEWLLPLLEERQMSVEDLANEAGITRASIYFYLSDASRPKEGVMIAICRALGRPPEEGLSQYTPKVNGRPRGQGSGPREVTAHYARPYYAGDDPTEFLPGDFEANPASLITGIDVLTLK